MGSGVQSGIVRIQGAHVAAVVGMGGDHHHVVGWSPPSQNDDGTVLGPAARVEGDVRAPHLERSGALAASLVPRHARMIVDGAYSHDGRDGSDQGAGWMIFQLPRSSRATPVGKDPSQYESLNG